MNIIVAMKIFLFWDSMLSKIKESEWFNNYIIYILSLVLKY